VNNESREARVSAAYVALTDTLVAEFDIIDLLHTLIDACIDLLDIDAGGLLLADGQGTLQLMASSVEDIDVVEVVQMSAEAGPCWECFTTGSQVSVPDIERSAEQWPDFRRVALQQGYHAIHATPMRLRGQVIGTLNLFTKERGTLAARDVALAQSLTDVATIAILQERGTRHLQELSTQLQGALESRIAVEQAKGLIAQSLDLTMDAAFALLRNHARSTGQHLQAVASSVTSRELVLDGHRLVPARTGRSSR
jgi:GAF domain-containing protein